MMVNLNLFSAAMAYLNTRPYGVVIADAQSRILFVNLAACDLLDAPDHTALIGGSIADLIAPGVKHPHDKDMTRFVREGRMRKIALTGQVRAQTVDGQMIDLIVSDREMFWVGTDLLQSCKLEKAT